MSKALVLMIALTLAVVFVPAEVSAYPISVAGAQAACAANNKTGWTNEGGGRGSVCSWCDRSPTTGKLTGCHWIACDSDGCDQFDARKKPRRPVRFPR